MKKSKFIALAFSLIICFAKDLFAQDGAQYIGLRLGAPSSLSYKYFSSENNAFEVTAGTYGSRRGFTSTNGFRWYSVSAAYLLHKDLEQIENLKWYYGGGASAQYWTWNDTFYQDQYSGTSFGVQGYIGLEYNFENIPLNLTLDWVPTVFINGFNSGFGAGFGSLAVRYVISK